MIDTRGGRGHLGGCAECLVERREDGLRRDVAVSGVVVDRLQYGKGLPGTPEAVGDDGDGVVETDDTLDAGHRLGGSGVHRLELAAVHGSHIDGGVQHARHTEVDAVHGAAVYLGREVEPGLRRAANREAVGVLERRTRRHRQRRGDMREFAERGAPSRGVVHDTRALRAAFRRTDAELPGRGREEHLLGGRTGNPHAELARAADCRGATGDLEAEPAGDAVAAVVHAAREGCRDVVAAEGAHDITVRVLIPCRRFLHPDEAPVGLHVLGRHHGESGQRPLPHLAVRDEDGDDVVGGHRDPGGELSLLGRVGGNQRVPAGCEGEPGHAEQEAAAGDRAGPDEGAPRPLLHDAFPSPCVSW